LLCVLLKMPKRKSVVKNSLYYRNYRKTIKLAINLPILDKYCNVDGNESEEQASSANEGHACIDNDLHLHNSQDNNQDGDELLLAEDAQNQDCSIQHAEDAQEQDGSELQHTEDGTDSESQHVLNTEFDDSTSSSSENSVITASDVDNDDTDSESSSALFDTIDNGTFEEKLGTWLITADSMGLTRKHANSLLRLLKQHPCFSQLHIDSRTVTRRPKKVDVVYDSVYFGIENALRSINGAKLQNALLELQVGIDGVPIHVDSNKMQMWPILISTVEISPLVVSLWYGSTKPSSMHDFLHVFLEDLKHVVENGVTIDGRLFEVSLHSIIADAPARAMLKQIKGHNARES
jgi:hypothetical protein